MRMNVYYDRIKRSLTFLKSQYLYTMHWAMFDFSILYVDSYMQVFAS